MVKYNVFEKYSAPFLWLGRTSYFSVESQLYLQTDTESHSASLVVRYLSVAVDSI